MINNTLCALLLLAVFSNSAKFQKVNFSGVWKVDSLKTNYGGFGPAAAPVELRIAQTKDSISVKGTLHTGRGDTRSIAEKLPLDGKPMSNSNGTATGSVSIKWSGQALVKSSTFHDSKSNSTYQATETWTLSPDSKTLTIDRVVANDGEGGHGASNAVYHRE